ncbi:MAG: nitroreductase/quinone reductase family protein, partial [Nocardioidaceae bacterium]
GAPLLLLTTTGARTGRPHTTPAVYAEDGDRLLVFGSNAGQDHHPAWYHNLLANPQVLVERGDESFPAVATVLTGAERDHLYAEQAHRDPAFVRYQAGTARVIPVVALTRVDASDRGGAATAQLRQIHAGLRSELASLRQGVDDYLAGRTDGVTLPEQSDNIRKHCLTFCGSLHAHHTREDGVFDQLERQLPGLTEALDRLRREHVVVAELNNRIADLVEKLGTGDDEQLRAELNRLSTELEAHFDYEEQHLGPALDAA